jgi:proline iminopeptidase
MIMGIGGQLTQWPPGFRQALCDQGFELILVDNRDVGLSSSMDHLGVPNTNKAIAQRYLGKTITPPYTLEDMAEDHFELMTHLEIERCHVLGISMGSMIAQIFASKYANLTQTLNLFHSNTGKRRHSIIKPKVLRALTNRIKIDDAEAFIKYAINFFQVVGSPDHQRPESELREYAAAAYKRARNQNGFKRQLMAIISTGDREQFFKNIQAPTAVVHGHKDPLMPLAAGKSLVRDIPNAKGFYFKDLGHDLPDFYSETFAQIVRNNANLSPE